MTDLHSEGHLIRPCQSLAYGGVLLSQRREGGNGRLVSSPHRRLTVLKGYAVRSGGGGNMDGIRGWERGRAHSELARSV